MAAQNSIDTPAGSVDDLNVVSKELGGSSVFEKVLLKIKNTMSDGYSAENSFHRCYKSFEAPLYRTLSLVGIKSDMNKQNLQELIILLYFTLIGGTCRNS